MSTSTVTTTNNFECIYTISNTETQLDTGVPVVVSDKLWYFYRSYRSETDKTIVIKTTTFNLSFVDAEAFQNSSAWSEPTEVLTSSLGNGHSTDGHAIEDVLGLFALPFQDSIYLFWYNSHGHVFGTKSTTEEDVWEPRYQIQGMNISSDLGAHLLSGYVFEDKILLVWLNSDSLTSFVYINYYNPENIHPAKTGDGQVWTTDSKSFLATSFEKPVTTNITSISAAFTILTCVLDKDGKVIGQDGKGTTASRPFVFVAIQFDISGSSYFREVLTYEIDPDMGLPAQNTITTDQVVIDNYGDFPMLDLDASNTMYVYSINDSGTSSVQRQPLMNANGFISNAKAESLHINVNGTDELIMCSAAPKVCYVAGSAYASELNTTSDPNDPANQTLHTIASNLYRFIFGGGANSEEPLACYIQFYGRKHVIATVNDLYLKNSINPDIKQQALVAKGIIDGPLPIPGENLKMLSQGGTVTEWDLYKPIANVTYGTNDSEEKTHQIDINGSVGTSLSFDISAGIDQESDAIAEAGIGVVAEAEVGATTTLDKFTQMAGIKIDADLKFSSGGTWSWGEEVAQESNIIGLTRVLPKNYPGENVEVVLSTDGYISGCALSVICISLVFENPLVNPGVIPSRPSFVSMMPQSKVLLNGTYTADYAFTPGDLSSYSINSINQKMADTYSKWKTANPDADDPFGDCYKYDLEDSKGYIEKVVNKHALKIGKGDKNYLEFSISNDGLSESRIDLSKFNFQEWSVEVEGNFYSAVTFESLTNVSGLELKGYLEAGLSFGFGGGYESETNRSENWGISAVIENFPQATLSGQVCAYSFRLYFLPANNLWAQEVIQFSDYNTRPANEATPIDPNSCPWKIMFVVLEDSISRLP